MNNRSFKSIFMVASCAGAALACYMVSLRVAAERAALEDVETKIVLAQRDIRLLQTEIGTRGRLAQLEKWNVKVLALSAPAADQFLDGSFALARLVSPRQQQAIDAPVVLASAPRPPQAPLPPSDEPSVEREAAPAPQLLHQASLKLSPAKVREAAERPRSEADETEAAPKSAPVAAKPVKAAPSAKLTPDAKGPASKASSLKAASKPAAAAAKPADKAPAKRPAKLASADPLAPLPAAAKPKTATSKDSGKAR